MTIIKAAGRLLAADQGKRELSYLLLPFGEPGNTSAGRVTASAGVLTLPSDPTTLVANDEHDYKRPLGRFTSVTEAQDGLRATVRVLETTAGNDLLLEAHEGVKTGISVEIDRPVIRDGKLLGGELTGAGFCVRPAFPSAQLVASDMGDLADAAQAAADAAQAVADQAAAIAGAQNQDNPPAPSQESNQVPQATAAAPAAGAPILQATQQPAAAPKVNAFMALAETLSGLQATADQGGPQALQAALTPITQADAFDVATVPDYVGELYRGRTYAQRYAPLVTQKNLTAYKSHGWRFKDGMTPTVDDYAGDLGAVPSNPVELESVEMAAKRLAGGHTLDRVYTDLPDAGAMAAYLRESQDDYLRKIDARVLDHLGTFAQGNHTETVAPAAPAFYSGSEGWLKLIHGARVLLDQALPTYAIVGSDLWFEMGLTSADQRLEYLSTQLGLEEGQLDKFKLVGAPYSATSMNGKVIVGAAGGTTLEQLPGGPVRVNTVGIASGSIDHGVFGYYKLWTPDKRYVVSVVDVLSA